MMDHSDILARVNSALTGIQLVLASCGTVNLSDISA
jgi:hypothetical protein